MRPYLAWLAPLSGLHGQDRSIKDTLGFNSHSEKNFAYKQNRISNEQQGKHSEKRIHHELAAQIERQGTHHPPSACLPPERSPNFESTRIIRPKVTLRLKEKNKRTQKSTRMSTRDSIQPSSAEELTPGMCHVHVNVRLPKACIPPPSHSSIRPPFSLSPRRLSFSMGEGKGRTTRIDRVESCPK